MRSKKRRRLLGYGALGLGLGIIIGVGKYEHGDLGAAEARIVIWGFPIAGVLLAIYRNRRTA